MSLESDSIHARSLVLSDLLSGIQLHHVPSQHGLAGVDSNENGC